MTQSGEAKDLHPSTRTRAEIHRSLRALRITTLLCVLFAACGADRGESAHTAANEADDVAAAPDTATRTEPVEVVRAYYDAIDGGEFRSAYLLWEQEGAASGQSFEEFSSGYAETQSVSVATGDIGRVEGAAGSQYIEIPVIVTATTTSGEEQRFEGTYTLRRSMVPGAEDADWNIYTAELTRTP